MAGLNRAEEAALIQKLKKTYDLSKDEDVLKLYTYLQSGSVEFMTPEGRALDDEVYEKAQALLKSRSAKRSVRKREAGGHGSRLEPVHPKGVSAAGAGESGSPKKKRKKKIVVLTRKEARIRRILMGVLFLMALTCLGYFGFYVYDSYLVDREAKRLSNIKNNTTINDMYAEKEVVVEDETGGRKVYKVLDQYKSLFNQNQNLIGWLKIADTHIDYPVMQCGDNEYYLTHNSNLEEDRNGALFMDSACSIQEDNVNRIIYGHNMRSGKMFGDLDKYESQKFYETHKRIYFDTIYEEGTYEVMYVFRSHVYQKDEVAFKYYQFIDVNSEEEFLSNMQEMSNMALYQTGVTAEYGDHLLTLSTCDYEEADGRFVVVAKRVE